MMLSKSAHRSLVTRRNRLLCHQKSVIVEKRFRSDTVDSTIQHLTNEVHRVFGDVQLYDGTTLAEAKAMDRYVTGSALQEVRERSITESQSWSSINNDDVVAIVFNFTHFDNAGKRYHFPAVLASLLRQDPPSYELSTSIAYFFSDTILDIRGVFTISELCVIVTVLTFLQRRIQDTSGRLDGAIEYIWEELLANASRVSG